METTAGSNGASDMSRKVQAIFFDMGGVFLEFSPDYNREDAIRYSMHSPEVIAFSGESFDVNEYILHITRDIERVYSDVENTVQPDAWRVLKSNLETFFRRKVPYPVIRRIFWDYVAYLRSCFIIRPESAEILRYCHEKKYIIGLISNVFHPSIIYKELFTEHDIIDFFYPLVFSSDLRFKKPNPEIFHYALSFHDGLKPGDCLFVGDTFDIDVVGARRSGMRPVWLNADDDLPCPEDVIRIRALSELKNIV